MADDSARFAATESDALHAEVRAFITASLERRVDDGDLTTLALQVARYQAAHVPAFARLVRARHVDLEGASTTHAIPAVPTDVFRLARVAAHPATLDVALFRTSGTTTADRGEHALRTTTTYAQAALAWGSRLLFPDARALGAMVLAPPHAAQPTSSLGFMLDLFTRELAGPSSFHVTLDASGQARLDLDGIAEAAAQARASAQPMLVLATSFALVHLLDAASDLDLRLPEGSRVMQTGGFKGRSREVAPDALRALAARAFAVPEAMVVGEYGMTELSSQLYEGTVAARLGSTWAPASAQHGRFVAPPWVRVDAVDPVSLAPLPAGAVGVARILDLANVDSAIVVQTADRVRVIDGSVELRGRLPGAVPRGCSIAIDEMLGGA